ncbi:MAG TPA: rhodanese-like domain-containing protein [Saprospiraceae bacterium]|nr:rhodanese-like domain-containing protein [Saprospiraceae bacterium]
MSFSSIKILALAGLLFAVLTARGQIQSKAYRTMLKSLLDHSVPEVQVQEAARDSARILFLDAREPDEYAVSHIKHALHVGYEHYDTSNLAGIQKDRRIVVYCSVGYRSEKVAEKLLAAGFNNVSNLYGGIFEWANQDNPVFNDKGRTQEIHAFSRTWGIWLKKGKKVY